MPVQKRIFSRAQLHELVSAEHGAITKKRSTIHVLLHPWYLNNIEDGLWDGLYCKLKAYDPKLEGIIMGYENLKSDLDKGEFYGRNAEILYPVTCDIYLFQPAIGSKLHGVVNVISPDHIGCLVHTYFNATIKRPDNESYDQWNSRPINFRDTILFTVKDLDYTGTIPYIEGELETEKKTPRNKSKKTAKLDIVKLEAEEEIKPPKKSKKKRKTLDIDVISSTQLVSKSPGADSGLDFDFLSPIPRIKSDKKLPSTPLVSDSVERWDDKQSASTRATAIINSIKNKKLKGKIKVLPDIAEIESLPEPEPLIETKKKKKNAMVKEVADYVAENRIESYEKKSNEYNIHETEPMSESRKKKKKKKNKSSKELLSDDIVKNEIIETCDQTNDELVVKPEKKKKRKHHSPSDDIVENEIIQTCDGLSNQTNDEFVVKPEKKKKKRKHHSPSGDYVGNEIRSVDDRLGSSPKRKKIKEIKEKSSDCHNINAVATSSNEALNWNERLKAIVSESAQKERSEENKRNKKIWYNDLNSIDNSTSKSLSKKRNRETRDESNEYFETARSPTENVRKILDFETRSHGYSEIITNAKETTPKQSRKKEKEKTDCSQITSNINTCAILEPEHKDSGNQNAHAATVDQIKTSKKKKNVTFSVKMNENADISDAPEEGRPRSHLDSIIESVVAAGNRESDESCINAPVKKPKTKNRNSAKLQENIDNGPEEFNLNDGNCKIVNTKKSKKKLNQIESKNEEISTYVESSQKSREDLILESVVEIATADTPISSKKRKSPKKSNVGSENTSALSTIGSSIPTELISNKKLKKKRKSTEFSNSIEMPERSPRPRVDAVEMASREDTSIGVANIQANPDSHSPSQKSPHKQKVEPLRVQSTTTNVFDDENIQRSAISSNIKTATTQTTATSHLDSIIDSVIAAAVSGYPESQNITKEFGEKSPQKKSAGLSIDNYFKKSTKKSSPQKEKPELKNLNEPVPDKTVVNTMSHLDSIIESVVMAANSEYPDSQETTKKSVTTHQNKNARLDNYFKKASKKSPQNENAELKNVTEQDRDETVAYPKSHLDSIIESVVTAASPKKSTSKSPQKENLNRTKERTLDSDKTVVYAKSHLDSIIESVVTAASPKKSTTKSLQKENLKQTNERNLDSDKTVVSPKSHLDSIIESVVTAASPKKSTTKSPQKENAKLNNVNEEDTDKTVAYPKSHLDSIIESVVTAPSPKKSTSKSPQKENLELTNERKLDLDTTVVYPKSHLDSIIESVVAAAADHSEKSTIKQNPQLTKDSPPKNRKSKIVAESEIFDSVPTGPSTKKTAAKKTLAGSKTDDIESVPSGSHMDSVIESVVAAASNETPTGGSSSNKAKATKKKVMADAEDNKTSGKKSLTQESITKFMKSKTEASANTESKKKGAKKDAAEQVLFYMKKLHDVLKEGGDSQLLQNMLATLTSAKESS